MAGWLVPYVILGVNLGLAALVAIDRFVHKQPAVEADLRNELKTCNIKIAGLAEEIDELRAEIQRMRDKASEQGSSLMTKGNEFFVKASGIETKVAVMDARLMALEAVIDRRRTRRGA